MKNFFKHIILFIIVTFSGTAGVYAQLFPVQLTPVFNSPYSVKIADYATSIDTKMQLLINPTDISISQRQVRLKLYIQGNGLNIQSSDYMAGQRPIFINGGELQTLTNTDIAALFRLENLQGITAAQYANGLPEGMYSFCFEMYDFVTNQRISQKSCASLYLILNDPPLLNTPQKNEQIAASEFPNIMFTWTPRQINATNISYKFELKQLIDPSLDPQFAFQMSPILYEETLFGTALLYNLNMPILTPGMRYAWRIRAISTTGLSENAVFKNDGYSEIYSFKYTGSCAAPTFLLSEAQGNKSVKISWQGLPEHTRYQVQYKKQNVPNAQWFSTNSLNTQSLITNLEPGVTYQFRVGSSCDPVTDGVQSFTYSGISTFTTPIESGGVSAYNCGIIPKINIQNQKPLTNLIQSETFTAGDFPVTVLELQEQHSPYSGRGYIIVPYLADTKIAVEFNNIIINTDYQLISGVVETSYNPDWKNVIDTEDFTGEGQGGQIEEKVPFDIKNIVVNANGDIVVNGKNGEQVTIPGGKDTVITDSSGKVYTVDSKGNGSNEGAAPAPGGKPTPENTDGVDKSGQATAFTAKGATIVFSGNGSKYAFDVMPSNATATLQKLYKKVGDAALPYKAVLNGDTDTVVATVTITDTIVKPEKIVFKTQNGANVPSTRNDKTFVLTVKGNQTYAEEQILATIQQGDKWKVIGTFMLVHISAKEVNVALVPTDATSQNKLEEVIANTQAIYNKAGVKVNFTKQPILDISKVISGNTIQTEKNTLTSTYSTEQQSINSLYQTTESSYVLFVTDKVSSTGQQGYMRLNGQFGYVFKSGLAKTPAHELGHGIFKLEHPFELYKTPESSTDLLMDNSSTGNVLNHQDWKQINDPLFKLYAFQSQASGEFANYVVTPDYRIVNITESNILVSDKTNIEIPSGTCPGFATYDYDKQSKEFKNIKYYYWNNQEKLYKEKNTKEVINPVSVTPKSGSLIRLFYNYSDCPAGAIDLKFSEIASEYQTANGLLSIIKKNQINAKVLNCVDFNSNSTEDPKEKGWAIAGSKAPLNCTADNIRELLKFELSDINGITSSFTSEQTNKALEQVYKDCLFENIDIQQRIVILDNLINKAKDDADWEFSKTFLSVGDNFFLDNLILTTPEKDRLKLLKDGFMKNNSQWIKNIFEKSTGGSLTNNDATMTEIVPLFRGLSAWVSKYYKDLGVKPTMATTVDIGPDGFSSFDYPVASINPVYLGTVDDGSGPFDFIDIIENIKYKPQILGSSSVKIYDSNLISFQHSLRKVVDGLYISSPGNEPKDIYERYELNVNPFEPVIMIASRNYLNLGIEKGVEYTVPAFMAAAYQQAIIDDDTNQSIRSLGNGVAMGAAVITATFTGGTSYLAYLTYAGGVVAVGDELIKNDRLKLNQDSAFKEKYESYYDAWDVFYNSVMIADGVANVYSLANNLRKVNLVRSTKAFYSKMKSFDFNGGLMNVWKGLKGAINTTTLGIIAEAKGNIPEFYQAILKVGYKTEIVGDIVKVYTKSGTDVLAEISQNSIRFKYNGWGKDIITNSDITTTCIAKFDDLLDGPGSKWIKYDLPEGAFGRGKINKGGINILDVDDITYSKLEIEASDILKSKGIGSPTKSQIITEANEIFWNRYNLPFLEEAFSRGDDIRLLTEPQTLFSGSGFYQREIEVITIGWKKPDGTFIEPLKTKYNYKFNDVTKSYEKIK
ncbi:fibronectin type III domain-containing protein [Flavobacterium sp. N1736]|uniref:fibronectin type III domain-containing protein n=1 Tax=Flavobacterium sp. N1736 TaxID=2986823 RepID=UPI0022258BC6|nr:fibronectin type III domain-containing protein [Flavobacterium sp. N1736]